MGITVFALLAVLTFAIVYLIATYNDLVALKHDIDATRLDLDSLIAQRHEELPKLVDYCREKLQCDPVCDRIDQCMAAVFKAHQQGDVTILGEAETALRKALSEFHTTTNEFSDDLNDDERHSYLQNRVATLQIAIADRRERYNDLVGLNNMRIDRFPDIFVARRFDFKAMDGLHFQEEEMMQLEIKGLFV